MREFGVVLSHSLCVVAGQFPSGKTRKYDRKRDKKYATEFSHVHPVTRASVMTAGGLAVQATLLVEPADERESLVGRLSLVRGPALIERFESLQGSNRVFRKPHLLELVHVRHGWVKLSEFHGSAPAGCSLPAAGCQLPSPASSSHLCLFPFLGGRPRGNALLFGVPGRCWPTP